jgi:hypothetical protein
LRITNKAGLPEPLVKAVRNDTYDRGDVDFTVTELLRPARAHALIKQHWDEIEVDASELVYALCGQIGHAILERAADSRFAEYRFYHLIDCGSNYGSKTISGRVDLWHEEGTNDQDELPAKLSDYKFCSMWAVKDGVPSDWKEQVNMLAWLARENGVPISEAEIVAIFRDWSKPRARRERSYPPIQTKVCPVELWDHKEIGHFIVRRIQALMDAERGTLPLCSDEERWKDADGWAVKKRGAKRADRVVSSLAQAKAIAARSETEARLHLKDLERSIQYDIEFRRGVAKRCEDYCAAAPFCEQFKAEKREESF